MKIKDLIEMLKNQDPEKNVVIDLPGLDMEPDYLEIDYIESSGIEIHIMALTCGGMI